MNKQALFTKALPMYVDDRKQEYILRVYDLEPSGIIISAYSDTDSKSRIYPVSEKDLNTFSVQSHSTARSDNVLESIVNSLSLIKQDDEYVLSSNIPCLTNIKKKPSAQEIDNMVNDPNGAGPNQSIYSLLVTGLAELCKVKPAGTDAVQYLGQWLLVNNPAQPAVWSPEDDEQ